MAKVSKTSKKAKINKVVNFQNLTPDLLEILHKKYPDGYQNHVIKVTTPKSDFFYAVTLDTEESSYLIKVPVKIDSNPEEFDEKDYNNEEENITPDENFADNQEEIENVADSDE
jgi:hypothetical protein